MLSDVQGKAIVTVEYQIEIDELPWAAGAVLAWDDSGPQWKGDFCITMPGPLMWWHFDAATGELTPGGSDE
jgi:hypothetical protein